MKAFLSLLVIIVFTSNGFARERERSDCNTTNVFANSRYTIKSGDKLWNILKDNSAKPLLGESGCLQAVSKLNPGVDWKKLESGMVIVLWSEPESIKPSSNATILSAKKPVYQMNCDIKFTESSDQIVLQKDSYITAKCSKPAYIHSRVKYGDSTFIANSDSKIYLGENKYLSDKGGMDLLVLDRSKIGTETQVDIFVTEDPLFDPDIKKLPMNRILADKGMATRIIWHGNYVLKNQNMTLAH